MSVGRDTRRVADLVFRVYDRALHPDWLGAGPHRRVARTGWTCDLRLVDGGHLLTWAAGPVRLTELLAAPPGEPLPEAGLRFGARPGAARSMRVEPGAAVVYQACVEVERAGAAVFAQLCEELALDAGRPGASTLFDRRSAGGNRLVPPALSFLRCEPTPAGLAIQAIHTYPHERAVVRTQTLIEHEG